MDSRPNDETLLLAVAERDMGAFRTLYERHAGWLAIRLARRCNDRDLVADAIQDTFVAVWQKPRGFRGDGDIGQALARLSPEMRAVIQAVVLNGRAVHPHVPGTRRQRAVLGITCSGSSSRCACWPSLSRSA